VANPGPPPSPGCTKLIATRHYVRGGLGASQHTAFAFFLARDIKSERRDIGVIAE
jgi:hypothetical protein